MQAPLTATLPAHSELRFHVGADKPGTVKLISGNAELFGVELAPGKEYLLPQDKNGSIATFYGASLETRVESEYVVPEPPSLMRVMEVHQRLEARREVANTQLRDLASKRDAAKADGGASGEAASSSASEGPAVGVATVMGPRVVVVGPEDSGKSTLCKTLLAYAARMGWCPLFVDCDIGQGEIVVPGCIAASPVDRTCLSVEYGLQKLTPLAVFLGGVSAGTDTKLYSYSAGVVARLVSQYFAHNAHAAASGCIINTMGWVDGVGYELLVSTIRALQADVVLVIGQDKLFNDLERDLRATKDWHAKGCVVIEKLPRSEGVVSRSTGVRKDSRKARIREYFYGKDGSLAPYSRTLSFDDFTLVKLSSVTADVMSMPVGYKQTDTSIRVRAAETAVTPDLASCLCGVSFATALADVPNTNVAGFVLIKSVDMESRTVEALFPSAEPMPSAIFIRSTIGYVE